MVLPLIAVILSIRYRVLLSHLTVAPSHSDRRYTLLTRYVAYLHTPATTVNASTVTTGIAAVTPRCSVRDTLLLSSVIACVLAFEHMVQHYCCYTHTESPAIEEV
jgi:hypothetical protein